MRKVCVKIRDNDPSITNYRIAITSVNGTPVSAALAFWVEGDTDPEIHTFTKWQYRRCGYGSLAVTALGVGEFYYQIGRSEKETVGFYESL